MKRNTLVLSILVTFLGSPVPLRPDSSFLRGDANADGAMDISDLIRTLLSLYAGGPSIPCLDAADTNDDGRIDLADAIYNLSFLFRAGAALPEPFAACGADVTADALDCAAFEICPPPSEAHVVLHAHTVVLDPGETTIESFDGATVILSGSTAGLAPGKVLLSSTGRGLLRRVLSVREEAGRTILETSQATLEDAFEEAEIAFHRDLGYPTPSQAG